MRSRITALLLLMLAQATIASSLVQAQNLVDPRGRDRGELRESQARGLSLDEAVRMVEKRHRARAVKAETVMSDGRRVHEIRLLNADGKVWKVRVDAATGRSY